MPRDREYMTQKQREWRERLIADPERYAAYKAHQRARYHERKRDPEQAWRIKENNQAWYAEARQDPAFLEKANQRAKARAARKKAEDPESWKLEQKKRSLRHVLRRRGMAESDYQKMVEDQNNLCAICGKAETKIKRHQVCRLSLDHDHETGAIRGLLCDSCNRGLGFFGDSTTNLWRAFNYLTNHKARRLRLVS